MISRRRKVIPGLKATKAFYPNNLSSISLSYKNNQFKVRNLLPIQTQFANPEESASSHISQMEVS